VINVSQDTTSIPPPSDADQTLTVIHSANSVLKELTVLHVQEEENQTVRLVMSFPSRDASTLTLMKQSVLSVNHSTH